jgi:hypothetical protein
LLFSTLLTLYVVPAVYSYLSSEHVADETRLAPSRPAQAWARPEASPR